MAFWNDELGTHLFNPNGYTPTNTYVYAVPDAWIENATLSADGFEKVYAHLYGATWRSGNDDGSRYIVLDASARVLPATDTREAKPIG
jgi:hypothetical protein